LNESRATLRQRLNLSRLALAHPRCTVWFWVLITGVGALAGWRMPVALFPDIEFPVIAVTIDAPSGQSLPALPPALLSLSTDQQVSVAIERRLLSLANRGAISTTEMLGRTSVVVPFDVGISLEAARQRVAAALAGVGVPPPYRVRIKPIDLNESPIVILAVDAMGRQEGIDPFIAALERMAGVARVNVLGRDLSGSDLPPTRVRLNGVPALALQVIKQAGANTLEVARAVDKRVVMERSKGEMRISALRAEAPYVREATRATLEALWLAAILSMGVIHPFLRSGAATAIAGLTIPTSLVGTFLVMSLAGFKFETITLLALALVIGIIVDDAIVDLENIVRHLPQASDPKVAARRATDEIGFTVTAATLTIVAVFLPVGLMGGVVGMFFRPFGLTIAAAVLTSLLVARTLTPVLAARWLRPGRAHEAGRSWVDFAAGYRQLLGWSLAHPGLILIAAVGSLGAGLLLIPLIPQGFIPALDRGECDVRFSLESGSGLAASDQSAQWLAHLIAQDRDVSQVLSVAGSDSGNVDAGIVHVTLRPDRHSRTSAVEARLRAALAHHGRARVSVDDIPIIAVAAEQPLAVTLTSLDQVALRSAAEAALKKIGAWPGVADASLVGLGADGDGTWLRRDGIPAAVVRGNLTGTVTLGDITQRAKSELPSILPAGVKLELEGESAQAADVFGQFAPALGFAVAGVLLVLLLLFRSLQDPLAIGAALPLAVIGALFGLFVTRSDFGIVSLLGLVFLVGLVSKNAIILVDRVNQLRAAGMSIDNAILEAGPVRLRPIMMTTAAAILGMVPVAMGFGAGAELRSPMAVAIIGGLSTSSLLSLVVVPVMYRQLDRLHARYRRAGVAQGDKLR